MRISAKTEYACLAMLELAGRAGSGEPVRIRTIADEHAIPSRFLVQILLQLKSAGLVSSTRGAAGGYQLARGPEEISLGEVMAVIEGRETELPTNLTSRSSTARVLISTWREIDQVQQEALNAITLAHLVDRVRSRTENMYYI